MNLLLPVPRRSADRPEIPSLEIPRANGDRRLQTKNSRKFVLPCKRKIEYLVLVISKLPIHALHDYGIHAGLVRRR